MGFFSSPKPVTEWSSSSTSEWRNKTDQRSHRLLRNAAELGGKNWRDTETQTEVVCFEFATQTVDPQSPIPSMDSNDMDIVISYSIEKLNLLQCEEFIGCKVWVEILLETDVRPVAAGRTQALKMSRGINGGTVEWNVDMRLHIPAHLKEQLSQQIIVWAACENTRQPQKVAFIKGLLQTPTNLARIQLEPSDAGAEIRLGPIIASIIA